MTDQPGITPSAPGEGPAVPRLGGATAYTPPDAAPQPPAPQPPVQQPPTQQPPAYGSAAGYQAPVQPYGAASGGYQAPAQPYGAASGYQSPAPTQPYAASGYQSQPPYGAQPQPPYGAEPQPPYGTHSPYAPQNAYPAGYGAPGQAMQQPQNPYGYVPGQFPPGYGPAPERSGLLGWIGLAMVTVAGVAAAVMGRLFGGIAGQFVELQQQLGSGTTLDANDPRVQQIIQQNGWMGFGTPVFLLGLAGFVVSIVAFATRRGRKPAVWGLILGVVLPVLSFALVVMAIMPYVQ